MHVLRFLLWHRGNRRIREGHCPWCYSSPPRPGCPVCDGDHQYGAGLDDVKRWAWSERWAYLINRL